MKEWKPYNPVNKEDKKVIINKESKKDIGNKPIDKKLKENVMDPETKKIVEEQGKVIAGIQKEVGRITNFFEDLRKEKKAKARKEEINQAVVNTTKTLEQKHQEELENLRAQTQEEYNKKIQDLNKKYEEEKKKLAGVKTVDEVLKNWENMSEEEKTKSEVIPRGAYLSEFQDFISYESNKPGLIKKVLEDIATPEDLAKHLKNEEFTTKIVKAVCSDDECRIRIQKGIDQFKKKKFFLEK